MIARLRIALAVTVSLTLASACGDDATPDVCSEDTRLECTCPDTGARGFIACEDGVLGGCVCSAADGGGACTEDIQCDDGAFCNGIERCAPDAEGADEHGCVGGMNTPFCEDDLECTIDTCSDRLNRCVFEPPDADGDGHADATCLDEDGEPLGTDCDDDDAMRFPGNLELCDADDRDEDCDPSTFGDKDDDGDGAFDLNCCNGENCGDDCDDSLLSRRPLQPEFCDKVDNDCDGEVDEEAADVPWYTDGDGDGFGGGDTDVIMSCIPIPGRSLVDTDCADANAARHPGQLELCDFVDNNCDGLADEGSMCGMPEGFPVGETGGAVGAGGGGGSSGSGGSGGSSGSGADGGTPMDGGVQDAGMDSGTPLPDLIQCPSRDLTGATEVSGSITSPVTWSGVVHVTADVRVSTGGRLTISEGTRIIVDPGVVINAGWNSSTAELYVDGSEDKPVTMCGKAALAGYWAGLIIGPNVDPASEVNWLLVSDAGDIDPGLRIQAQVPLADVHVTNSAGAGIGATTFGIDSTRLISTGNAGAPMEITDEAALTRLPTNSSWTGNGNDRIEIDDGAWTVTMTIHAAGVPYLLIQDLDFRNGSTLSIDPGVEIMVEPNVHVDLGWNSNTNTIHMNGTAEAPIIWRGRVASTASWQGMLIGAGVKNESDMTYVEIRHAGFGVPALDIRAAITLDHVTLDTNTGPALSINDGGLNTDSTHVSVINTAGAAASIHANAMTRFPTGGTFTNNGSNWVEIQQSTHITTTGTIDDPGIPFYLPFGTTTRSGSELTIGPGVEFWMGNNQEFLVGWNSGAVTIYANGTSTDPIIFRHWEQSKGMWEGVQLGPGVNTSSTFNYVYFQDGGDGGNGNLYLNMANALPAANLTNCQFTNGSAYGLFLSKDYSTDYSGNGNVFTGNTLGTINTP